MDNYGQKTTGEDAKSDFKDSKTIVEDDFEAKLSPVKMAARRAIESRFSRHLLEISAACYKQFFANILQPKKPTNYKLKLEKSCTKHISSKKLFITC